MRRARGSGAVGIAALLAVAGCGGPAAKQGPAFTIKVDGPYQAGTNPVVNLAITINRTERTGELVTLAAQALRKVGEDINAGNAPVQGEFKGINFKVLGPAAPDAGAVGNKIMHLSYDTRQLQQTVRSRADDDTILAGADDLGWWTPTNDDVIESYCRTHAGGAFCMRVAEK